MAIHLIKMAVGVESIEHLRAIQELRAQQAAEGGHPPFPRHITRNLPKRASELVEGGSIYWVIRGFVRVRQRLLACERQPDWEGRPACALLLDPNLVRVRPESWSAFQGWRYLDGDAAPADLAETEKAEVDLPADMAKELRELGLL
jgi:hypothetical protein